MNERQRIVAEALLMKRLRSLLRIDDDRYADPEYITHIEYQLFLDEKCVEGQYLQPDHWTSYTFPKGMALQPLVGLRPSDASEFCDWLTEHDAHATFDGWMFRLPYAGELSETQLGMSAMRGSIGGYWVSEASGEVQFERQDSPKPVEYRFFADRARDILHTLDLDHAISIVSVMLKYSLPGTGARYDVLARTLERAAANGITLARARVIDGELDDNLSRSLADILERAGSFCHPVDFDPLFVAYKSIYDPIQGVERKYSRQLLGFNHAQIYLDIADRLGGVLDLVSKISDVFSTARYYNSIVNPSFYIRTSRISSRAAKNSDDTTFNAVPLHKRVKQDRIIRSIIQEQQDFSGLVLKEQVLDTLVIIEHNLRDVVFSIRLGERVDALHMVEAVILVGALTRLAGFARYLCDRVSVADHYSDQGFSRIWLSIDSVLERSLHLAILLVRICGAAPAIEGIRIVKQR